MPSDDYDPSTLSTVDAAALVELAGWARDGQRPRGSTGALIRAAAVREIMLTGEDVDRIASLWRALRPAEEARCHMPRFGIRFLLGGEPAVEAALCWDCNNAYGYLGATEMRFTFDASSPAAVLLLMQVRHVLGIKSPGA